MMNRLQSFLLCVLLGCGSTGAQLISGISGVPGDNFPDVYLDGLTGDLTFDTDGIDVVAVLIGGPDVSTTGCNLCDGMNLPGVDALANASTWTVGYSAGSTQWIRTNPLQGRGFVGRMSEFFVDGSGDLQLWPNDVPPFLDFPEVGFGLATYPQGSEFEPLFDDGTGQLWEVMFATDDGGRFLTSFNGFPPGNFPPWATDDFYATTIGGTIDTIADMLPGVLDNDFDVEGGPLSAAAGTLTPSNGTVLINGDGSFVYTHDGSGALTDSFSYFASDGLDETEATVFITIVPEPQLGWLFGLVMLPMVTRRRM